jgi:hypothetical protein
MHRRNVLIHIVVALAALHAAVSAAPVTAAHASDVFAAADAARR